MNYKNTQIKAVLFDFDGTLTKPGSLNFAEFKRTIGCPVDEPVYEFIQAIPDSDEQDRAFAALEHFELEGSANSIPNNGVEDIILFLRSNGIRIGILSRNSRQSIEKAFVNFESINLNNFDLIISRDDKVKMKPDPGGVLYAAQVFDISVDQVMVVGDYIFDIQAGQAAGAVTVLLDNDMRESPLLVECDYCVSTLDELKDIIHLSTPLPAGKFPNDLLEDFFSKFPFDDPSLLIQPGVGEDIAAIDVNQEEVLVLKSDPITFVTDAIGEYAVIINANDIATSGATPRWFLTTLLFPVGATPFQILDTMYQLQSVCQKWGITLCGGHTEITDSVNRPVITGMLAGTVKKESLIDKRNMREGDQIIMTKVVALEGTAIIARELGERLLDLGMPGDEIESCKSFLNQISILKEAEIATNIGNVSAMHDVTEGGLATALNELSIAGKHQISINMDKIPIFTETQKLCGLLEIDPMGLIGSGSLLICCRERSTIELMERIRNADIQATHIGEVIQPGSGINAISNGKPDQWPIFKVDEITRLF